MNSKNTAPYRGVGRYAPSPSGDLHLGNLRTALLAWLYARSSGRQFVLRIEDLDRDRDNGSAGHQIDDLRAIGLDWDGEIDVQSTHVSVYEQIISELQARHLVYECTCTRRDILAAATAPHAPLGAYPGTCRNKTPAERAQDRTAIFPRRPALRLRSPYPGISLSFHDLVLGEVTGIVDDFVLQRGDGTIAYNLAVVIDDDASGVDQIVRGADLASGTARQLLLYDLLGLQRPEYAHVPLVLGPDKARLAKRDGAVTLRDFVASGIEATHVLRMLAKSLNLSVSDRAQSAREIISEILENFSIESVSSTPWVYTPTDVKHLL